MNFQFWAQQLRVSPTRTRLAQTHWNLSSSNCLGGKLKQDWNPQFTEILNMMQFADMSDSPQRSKGPAHWAKDSQCVSFWTLQPPMDWKHLRQRYSSTCLQYLLPIGSWSSLVNKQVLQVSQSQPVNLKEGLFVTQRLVWWRSFHPIMDTT